MAQIYLYNLESGFFDHSNITHSGYSSEVRTEIQKIESELVANGVFLLKTCQRTIVLSSRSLPMISQFLKRMTLNHTFNQAESKTKKDHQYRVYRDQDAYHYLLRVVCGLESRLVGETEIVSQFRQELENYRNKNSTCKLISTILQKCLQDAKSIRSHHFKGLCQNTYAALARKKVIDSQTGVDLTNPITEDQTYQQKVLIFGSGVLATALAKQLEKHCDVFICARNTTSVEMILSKAKASTHCWSLKTEFHSFSHVINTIGTSDPLWHDEHVENWRANHRKRLFIDLANPSPVPRSMTDSKNHSNFSDYVGLTQLMDEGQKWESQNKIKVEKAARYTLELASHRYQWISARQGKRNRYLQNLQPEVSKQLSRIASI